MLNLSWIEIIYWAATIIGGTLFLLRTILFVVAGGLGGHDFDSTMAEDLHTDVMTDMHAEGAGSGIDQSDMGSHTEVHADRDTDYSFKLLSLQGLTAFFMMFGLVGLAMLRAELVVPITVLGGITAGLFTVWILSLLFSQMKHLQSDGTIKLANAVGQSGSVYLSIPPKGTGQVQVSVQGSLKILDALSNDGRKIATGEKIRVTGVSDGNTLVVEKIT